MSVNVRIMGNSVLVEDTVNLGSLKLLIQDSTTEQLNELVKVLKDKFKKNLILNLFGDNLILLSSVDMFNLTGIVKLTDSTLVNPTVHDSAIDNCKLFAERVMIGSGNDVTCLIKHVSDILPIAMKDRQEVQEEVVQEPVEEVKPVEEVETKSTEEETPKPKMTLPKKVDKHKKKDKPQAK